MMTTMKKILFLSLISIALSACNATMKDFVLGGDNNPNDSSPPVSQTTSSTKAIKISPGAGSFSGSRFQGSAKVTATNIFVRGSHYQAKLAISQNRQN